jgi:hypothetical protein
MPSVLCSNQAKVSLAIADGIDSVANTDAGVDTVTEATGGLFPFEGIETSSSIPKASPKTKAKNNERHENGDNRFWDAL